MVVILFASVFLVKKRLALDKKRDLKNTTYFFQNCSYIRVIRNNWVFSIKALVSETALFGEVYV